VSIVALVITPLTRPKEERELRGLVHGVGGLDLRGDAIAGDAAWYRSPVLLGSVALVLSVLLYLPLL
jgi:SSS family solute:Na+ symporter